jgi:porin
MKRLSVIFILICCFTHVVFPQGDNTPGENSFNIRNMLGLENFESKTGVGFSFAYKGEVFSNLKGGISQNSVYLDNFDIIFNFNLNKLLGWEGAMLNTYILGNNGGDPSADAGAAQGISNIAAFHTWKLYQFWIEQNFLDDNLSFLAGLFDLNSEFDTRVTSGIFINPSHGIGPDFSMTGKNGPSIFPTTSMAIRASYNITNELNIRTAAFDGVSGDPNKPGGTHILMKQSDGLLFAGEFTYHSETDQLKSGFFKLSIGTWFYTGSFERLDNFDPEGNPLHKKGNSGAYVSAEKFLLAEKDSEDEGLSAFIRIGMADKSVNQVTSYLGAGIYYKGFIPGRENDEAGLAVSTIKNSDAYMKQMELEQVAARKYEHIIEFTYIFRLLDWINIQPDVQYVINPSNCIYRKSSFLFGTRLSVEI